MLFKNDKKHALVTVGYKNHYPANTDVFLVVVSRGEKQQREIRLRSQAKKSYVAHLNNMRLYQMLVVHGNVFFTIIIPSTLNQNPD